MIGITTHIQAIAIYLSIAVTTAAALFVAADYARTASARAVRHRGLICIAGGAVWPLLWLGAAEFVMVGAVHRVAVRRRHSRFVTASVQRGSVALSR